MKRFQKILYIVTTAAAQEATSKRVHSLAKQNGAQVCFVRILEESFIEQMGKVFSSSIKELTTLAQEHLQGELQQFAEDARWSDISTTSALLTGRDFIKIIEKVQRDQHDLVVKSRITAEEPDQLAMKLFRKCPCPVWIIRGSHQNTEKQILAALDLQNTHLENRKLNRKIIELAHSMAVREKGQVHYLNTLQLEYEGMMRGPRFKISEEEITGMKDNLHQISSENLAVLFEETGITAAPENIHLIEGDAGKIIPQAIQNLSTDTLVMGTVARSGIPGLLIGNKAEKILSEVQCTVLAVKPEGFISPVKIT